MFSKLSYLLSCFHKSLILTFKRCMAWWYFHEFSSPQWCLRRISLRSKPHLGFIVPLNYCVLQIYIQARNPANLNLKMVKDEYPDKPLELVGALGKKHHYQQFQPVVTLAKSYTVHWDAAAPAEVTVWMINFNRSVTTNSTKSHK